MEQLAGGEPLSPEYPVQKAPTVLLFGLHNAAETVGHLVAQRTPPSPMNEEFVGIVKYVIESFHDLLTGESGSPSNYDSSGGAITLLMNVSWQVPLRDTSKAYTRERLP